MWLAWLARNERGLPEMDKLADVHSRVHAVANEIVRSRGLGNEQECKAAFLLLEPLSAQVIAIIDRLESFMHAEARAKQGRSTMRDSSGLPGTPI
jgi:hypothetical protein